MHEAGRKDKLYVASLSGGKDSTAMVLRLVEEQRPLDLVLFCDTGLEFPQMYDHVRKVEQAVPVPIVWLKAERDFEYYMFHFTPDRRPGSSYVGKTGMSWAGPKNRWCTKRLKTQVIDQYLLKFRKDFQIVQYIGIAADEPERVKEFCYPLVEWGMTEKDCLEYCYKRGYDWGGLYRLFDRVSCWCCPLQGLEELRTLRREFPGLWSQLLEWESRTWRNFRKDFSVEELEIRFQFEEERIREGKDIRSREFHRELKKRLGREEPAFLCPETGRNRMGKVAVIDADLIGRSRHRFPNLACMKLSGWHKGMGDEVTLKTDYDGLEYFDQVYLSKVFTDTGVPEDVLKMENITYGGTGFYYDKAPVLPEKVEHCMPDYHLYDSWVAEKLEAGSKRNDYRFYLDYSIGFLTRGCFRKCQFCVNQNYDRVQMHSPLEEFVDSKRKKICLLDDNFFGHPKWEEMLDKLKGTGKPFQFRQGLDERLFDDRKCAALFSSRYDDSYSFAFDNVADAELIEKKIILARKYTDAKLRFYCFCGFDRDGKWDRDFWAEDVFSLLKRIEILMRHECLAYVMRFNRYLESPFRGVYVSIARWANQPGMFKKESLREFAEKNGRGSACYKYLEDFERQFPGAAYFYDLKFGVNTAGDTGGDGYGTADIS